MDSCKIHIYREDGTFKSLCIYCTVKEIKKFNSKSNYSRHGRKKLSKYKRNIKL